MQHVERRTTCAREHAQIERGAETSVLALVKRVSACPVRRREEDAVGHLAARRRELRECLGNRVKRTDDLIGPRAQVREHTLFPSETLEDPERSEDRGEQRRIRQDLTDQAKPVQHLAERRLAHRLAPDAGPLLVPGHRVPLECRRSIARVAVARAPGLGVVVGSRIELDEIELMPLGERDGRLGKPRRAFVLVGIEVPPHRERNAIDLMAGEREGDALA